MKVDYTITKFEEPDFEQWEKDLCAALVERVKLRTPERTGNLKKSIFGEVTDNKIILGSDVDYAPHVEYGTIHMSGHHMFRMAIEDGQSIADRLVMKYKNSASAGKVSAATPKSNGKVLLSK